MKEFNRWPRPPQPRYSKHEPEHTLRPAVAKRTASHSWGQQHRPPYKPYPKPSGEPDVTFVTGPTLPVTRNRGKRTDSGSRSNPASKNEISYLARKRLGRMGKR